MSDFARMLNKMTNHQRNQWAKAGYPGLKSPKKVNALIDMFPDVARELGITKETDIAIVSDLPVDAPDAAVEVAPELPPVHSEVTE